MQSQLLRKLPSFICDMVPYLGDYALRCAAVFQSHPDLLHDPQATSQVSHNMGLCPLHTPVVRFVGFDIIFVESTFT